MLKDKALNYNLDVDVAAGNDITERHERSKNSR
jgi:hypothetical protein